MTPEKRDRLAVKIFQIVGGEAEGRFAISVLLIIILGAIGGTAWRFLA
jgi:hypothetical protein